MTMALCARDINALECITPSSASSSALCGPGRVAVAPPPLGEGTWAHAQAGRLCRRGADVAPHSYGTSGYGQVYVCTVTQQQLSAPHCSGPHGRHVRGPGRRSALPTPPGADAQAEATGGEEEPGGWL